jgi:SAM-dependent methyltransferase
MASRWQAMARNLAALVRGQDLLTRAETAGAGLDAERHRAESVVHTLIDRHYGGWPLPPPWLRRRIGADDTALEFWAKGLASSGLVLDFFGPSPDGPVLDWGCGSGRTRLWLQPHEAWRANYHGCDVDGDAVAWLRDQGVEHVAVTDGSPPLPYPDGFFAGLFAFSVLTHISPLNHRAWYEEVRRVLRPGGVALVTTLGEWGVSRASPAGADHYRRHGWVFEADPRPGCDHHLSAVTETFTRAALGGLLEVDGYDERGYLDHQDAWRLRRP